MSQSLEWSFQVLPMVIVEHIGSGNQEPFALVTQATFYIPPLPDQYLPENFVLGFSFGLK